MSHEGFRLVSESQAQSEEVANAPLPREATEPAKIRVMKTEGTGVEIDWRDGHRSRWSFPWLRHACPCATCHEEREHDHRAPGVPPAQPAVLLPLYKPALRPDAVRPVGRYALAFDWNDGHTSGIYSWDYLRRHCVCAQCAASQAAE